MGFFDRLWGGSAGPVVDQLDRTSYPSLAFDDFLQMVEWSFNGNNYLSLHGTQKANPQEEVPNDQFDAYVRQVYRRDGIVAACIHARALVFSEVRFQFRDQRTRELFGARALAPLESPAPNVSTGELLTRMEQDVSLAGNWYGVRRGQEIHRLRPDWVDIVLGSPEPTARVLGYRYHPSGRGNGDPVMFSPNEVAHWSPIPDPECEARGISWLTAVLREILADLSATDHKLRFFEHAATPNLVIKAPESVTNAEQFKKFRDAIDADSSGVHNAYRTLYLAAGADVLPVGADMRQMDFKATQGAGETRIAAAARVPASVLGISEGLAGSSLNAGNYGMARRQFGDGFLRPQWRSACAALSNIIDVPGGADLWYDAADVAFLHEDEKDHADILATQAAAMRQLIDGGFDPSSVVAAVTNGDLSQLAHTGNLSVQLQPGGVSPAPETSSEENNDDG